MTLWRFVPHDPQAPAPEPRELGRSLRALHAALAGFPADLAPLSGVQDWLARLLAGLTPSPPLTGQDLDWLRRRLEALTPTVFETPPPAQALHGDASVSNVLRVDGRLLWNDLEDVCAGPVAWDVAGLIASGGGGEQFAEVLLGGYGDPGVAERLEPFLEAHGLYDVIWQAYEARRRPRAIKRAVAGLALLREQASGGVAGGDAQDGDRRPARRAVHGRRATR